ncbi:MAG: DnaB-like helicase N-terminal domain-containing protein, partial [Dehalococcoidales bacterium]|nr:DnaB-like helicase N-terminal domain-containing protein [Dehalococcoidales bacterium]
MTETRLPPHDIDAEEAVIGSILIGGTESLDMIQSPLQPGDFYSERCSLLYAAIVALYRDNKTINQITVYQQLVTDGKHELIGGAAVLSHLIANCPTSVDVDSYAEIVLRLSGLRRLINAGEQIAGIGYSDSNDLSEAYGRADSVLYGARSGIAIDEGFTSLRQLLDGIFEEQPNGTEQKPVITGNLKQLYTGFTSLDEMLDGILPEQLIILAARPAMGKTTLAMNIARNIALQQ